MPGVLASQPQVKSQNSQDEEKGIAESNATLEELKPVKPMNYLDLLGLGLTFPKPAGFRHFLYAHNPPARFFKPVVSKPMRAIQNTNGSSFIPPGMPRNHPPNNKTVAQI
jgi:hypothetical protein